MFPAKKKIDYRSYDGNSQEGQNAFFFGDPTAKGTDAENWKFLVYATLDDVDKENIRDFRLMTNLNNLLKKDTNIEDGLDIEEKQGKKKHIISRKKEFVETLVNEIAITLLKMVNRILWTDELDWNNANCANTKGIRWRSTDIATAVAFKYIKTLASSLDGLFELMIDLRFDSGVISDRMMTDYQNLIVDYTNKAGSIHRNSKKKH